MQQTREIYNQNGEVIDTEIIIIPDEIITAQAEAARQEAYAKEADPLFFKYQRDEVSKQEWLDKIAEIKLRYPKP